MSSSHPSPIPHGKTVVAIFAHPDDEAMVAGTLAQLSKQNRVIIVCATKGERGKNPEKTSKLGAIRSRELRQSAALLGVSTVHFLRFRDGTLCNATYKRLATRLEPLLDRYQPDILLTFEPQGVSGHIDHVTVTSVTTYWFYQKSYPSQLWQFGITPEMRGPGHSYFVHRPFGIARDHFDAIIDITAELELKLKAIRTHQSQQKDVSWMVNAARTNLPEEYFLIQTKPPRETRRF